MPELPATTGDYTGHGSGRPWRTAALRAGQGDGIAAGRGNGCPAPWPM